MRNTLILALAAITITACEKPAASPETTSSAVPATTPSVAADTMPADEAAFLALPRGQDDVQAFCAAFGKMGAFSDWTGRVGEVRVSSVDKTAAFEIVIGGKVHLDEAMQAKDPLYATLMGLQYDQPVRFSGTFHHGNGNADCNYVNGPFGVDLTALAPR